VLGRIDPKTLFEVFFRQPYENLMKFFITIYLNNT